MPTFQIDGWLEIVITSFYIIKIMKKKIMTLPKQYREYRTLRYLQLAYTYAYSSSETHDQSRIRLCETGPWVSDDDAYYAKLNTIVSILYNPGDCFSYNLCIFYHNLLWIQDLRSELITLNLFVTILSKCCPMTVLLPQRPTLLKC